MKVLHYRITKMLGTTSAAGLLLAVLAGCSHSDGGGSSSEAAAVDNIPIVTEACTEAASYRGAACAAECSRFPDATESAACDAACSDTVETETALCSAPLEQFATACEEQNCGIQVTACRDTAAAQFAQCNDACAPDALYCSIQCQQQRAADESGCGFLPAAVSRGGVALPILEAGQPAVLPAVLDAAELAVVEAADQRAESIRSSPVRLWTGAANTPVSIFQLEHDFAFGVPLDIREFEVDGEPLQFYGDIARRHANLLVAETSLKWRNSEPEEGVLRFDLADTELAWAESLGFDIKAHVLLWGNAPPLSSGSGTPEWLRDKFPNTDLTAAEKTELRVLIRNRVDTVVRRYSGRIDVWEVTNEMLNPLTSWFSDRLGQGIVDDIFRWAREADPGAQLVYNEWIKDIFTGLGGPDAVAVRDRVLELLAAGVPVDALGQQGHFAPGLVNIGAPVDLSQRTRIDDYAAALDTLAEPGLPIHITEVTFAAPDDPEQRAAQAEAIMRVWWGHPLVEEIILWNFWNPLGPRSHLNLGVYGDDRTPTRHGEAILSLLNDRWRTRVEGVTDADGGIDFRAIYGTYVAQWDAPEGPVHVYFRVARGTESLQVVAVSAPQ